jgi:hypothetical protein
VRDSRRRRLILAALLAEQLADRQPAAARLCDRSRLVRLAQALERDQHSLQRILFEAELGALHVRFGAASGDFGCDWCHDPAWLTNRRAGARESLER